MQFQGTRRDLGLGSVRDVSLVEARIAAAEMRRKVRSGVDPSAERPAARKSTPSFETAARACYETLKAGWKDIIGHLASPTFELLRICPHVARRDNLSEMLVTRR